MLQGALIPHFLTPFLLSSPCTRQSIIIITTHQQTNQPIHAQVIVGNRRDPAMMLALNVPDVKKAAAFYKGALGMQEVPYPLSRCVVVVVVVFYKHINEEGGKLGGGN
jgi:hypothetical protein